MPLTPIARVSACHASPTSHQYLSAARRLSRSAFTTGSQVTWSLVSSRGAASAIRAE